jgi:hypothetical protein
MTTGRDASDRWNRTRVTLRALFGTPILLDLVIGYSLLGELELSHEEARVCGVVDCGVGSVVAIGPGEAADPGLDTSLDA